MPDSLFRQAEAAARRLRVSRSELYAQAIAAYLTRDSQAVARGYFDAGRLEPEVARLGAAPMRDDCSDSWDLADAFGFELWLRVFFAHAASGQKGPRTPSRIE